MKRMQYQITLGIEGVRNPYAVFIPIYPELGTLIIGALHLETTLMRAPK